MTAAARCLAVLIAMAMLASCDRDDGPWLGVEGGGFIYNYRIGEFFYGVSVAPLRRLPEGGVIVATFENPAGGAPIVVPAQVRDRQMRYGLRTPALRGVRRDRPYAVTVALLDRDGRSIFSVTTTYRSTIDQADVPNRPLTYGPGYARVPDLPATAAH